jgi:murein L,D-transpeptidase YafK
MRHLWGLGVGLALLAVAPYVAADEAPPVRVHALVQTRTEAQAQAHLQQADRVVIEKERRVLTLYGNGRKLGSFQVALGKQPVGRKLCRGDNRTPEGRYYVSGRKENSDFHRALRLSYPSPQDVDRAREAGCDPGGDIMIHGLKPDWAALGKWHRRDDWTKGCIAVTNEEIERIWALVPDGIEVEIRP